MPKGRKPRAGQGKPKRQAAAKQGLPAAQATKAAGTKATSIASVPDADSSTKPASASGAAPSPIGLVNLGHTCYFNAVLQVLASAPPVQSYFLSPDQLTKKGPFGGAMREVLEASEGVVPVQSEEANGKARQGSGKAGKGRRGCYSPARLHNAVAKVAPHLKRGQEQDSHEALRVLLDGLETEEEKRLRLDAGPDPAALPAERSPGASQQVPAVAAEWRRSVVQGLFGGELSSTVVCGGCGYVSAAVESFMDLSLPMRRSGDSGASVSAAPPASAVDEEDVGDGVGANKAATRLSPKRRKALLKEERKARKLERAGRRREDAPSGSAGEVAQSSAADAAPAAQTRQQAQPGLAQPADSQVSGGKAAAVDVAGWHAACNGAITVPPNPDITSSGLADSTSGSITAEGLSPPPDGRINGAAGSCTTSADPDSSKKPPDHCQVPRSSTAALDGACRQSPDGGEELAAGGRALNAGGSEACSQQHCVLNGPSPDDGDSGDGELMAGLGDLFDESGTAEYVHSSPTDDQWEGFGWNDSGEPVAIDMSADPADALAAEPAADAAGSAAVAAAVIDSGIVTLESCLAAFFAPEAITWACPKELKEAEAVTGRAAGALPPSACLRRVSFSDAPAAVRFVPGSREARGVDLERALTGRAPFTRPLRHLEAELLVSARLDPEDLDTVTLELSPQSMELHNVSVLAGRLKCVTVRITAAREGSGVPEAEAVRVQGAVQLLMDCLADIVDHEGLDVLPAMSKGMTLVSADWDGAAGGWRVEGTLAPEVGEGTWVYPLPLLSADPDSAAAAPTRGFSAQVSSGINSAARATEGMPEGPLDGSVTSAAPDLDTPAETAAVGQHVAENDSVQSAAKPASDRPSTCMEAAAIDLSAAEPSADEQSERQNVQRSAGQRSATGSERCDALGMHESAGSQGPASAAAAHSPASFSGSSTADADCAVSDPDAYTFASPFVRRGQELATQHRRQEPPDAPPAPIESLSTATKRGGAHPLHNMAAVRQLQDSQPAAPITPGLCGAATCTCGVAHQGLSTLGVSDYVSAASLQARDASPQSGASLRRPSALRRGSMLAAAAAQRPATKRYFVRSAPPMLTAHLKRFEQDDRGRLRKIENWVSFPFLLKLGAHCEPADGDSAAVTSNTVQSRGLMYQLLGVVEHWGNSLRTGHYVAYVQRGTQLPAGFAALIQQGAAADSPSEPTAEQRTAMPEVSHNGQHAKTGSPTVAPSARRPPVCRESASQQTAQLKEIKHDSFAAAAGANVGVVPPSPDALSWFLCTDEVVKPVSWDTVARCKAYILLYMRIQ